MDPVIIRFAKRSLNVGIENMLHDNNKIVHDRSIEGLTSLMIAAESGNSELISILLKAGANPNAVDRGGIRALDLAKTTDCILRLQKCTSLVSPLYND
jgi:ankyrin repeat protein